MKQLVFFLTMSLIKADIEFLSSSTPLINSRSLVKSHIPFSSDVSKKRKLNMNDLSTALSSTMKQSKLKMDSQISSKNKMNYIFHTPDKRKFNLDLKLNKDSLNVDLYNKGRKLERKIILPNRAYMVTEFKHFVKNGIRKSTKKKRGLKGGNSGQSNLRTEQDTNEDVGTSSRSEEISRSHSSEDTSTDEADFNSEEGLVKFLIHNIKKKTEDEMNLTFDKGEEGIDVFLNDHHSFSLHLTESEYEKTLSISNVPSEGTFDRYVDNHFDFKRTFPISDTNPEEFKSYLEDIATQIFEKIKSNRLSIPFGTQIIDYLVIKLSPYYLAIFDEEQRKEDKFINVDVYKEKDDQDKLIEIQVFPLVSGVLYRLMVVKAETTFAINIKADNIEKTIDTILDQIKEILSKAEEEKYNFTTLIAKIEENIKELKCEIKEKNHKNIKFGILSLETRESEECPLSKTKFQIELFSYGYMRYVHIMADNDFLIEEFMINVNTKFSNNLHRALEEIQTEIQQVKEDRNQPGKDEEVSMKKVKHALNELAGEDYKCEDENMGYICSKITNGVREIVAMVREINDSHKGKFFRVNFIDPLKENSNKEEEYAHPEINIEESNGSSQLERMKKHADVFFNRIKSGAKNKLR